MKEYTDKSIKQVFQYFKGKISKDEIRLLADSNLWYLLCFVHTKIMPRKIKGGLMKEYTDKQINSMILYLRINKVAEIQYIDRQAIDSNGKQIDSGDLTFYDYMSASHLTKEQLISAAIDSGWKENWKKYEQ